MGAKHLLPQVYGELRKLVAHKLIQEKLGRMSTFPNGGISTASTGVLLNPAWFLRHGEASGRSTVAVVPTAKVPTPSTASHPPAPAPLSSGPLPVDFLGRRLHREYCLSLLTSSTSGPGPRRCPRAAEPRSAMHPAGNQTVVSPAPASSRAGQTSAPAAPDCEFGCCPRRTRSR